MINARQSAVTDAQQTQITEQQAQIVATQKRSPRLEIRKILRIIRR